MRQRRLESADKGQTCRQHQRSNSRRRESRRIMISAFINMNEYVNLSNVFMKLFEYLFPVFHSSYADILFQKVSFWLPGLLSPEYQSGYWIKPRNNSWKKKESLPSASVVPYWAGSKALCRHFLVILMSLLSSFLPQTSVEMWIGGSFWASQAMPPPFSVWKHLLLTYGTLGTGKDKMNEWTPEEIGTIFGNVTDLNGAEWRGSAWKAKDRAEETHGGGFITFWHEITGTWGMSWHGSLEKQMATQKLLWAAWRGEDSLWNASALPSCLLDSKLS